MLRTHRSPLTDPTPGELRRALSRRYMKPVCGTMGGMSTLSDMVPLGVTASGGGGGTGLLTNLVAVWCEAVSPVTDTSGNGETLTDHGTVGTTTGKIGTAGDFGTGSSTKYLDKASDAAVETGDIDFTMAAWVYLTATTKGYPSIIAKVVSDGSTVEYDLILRGSIQQFEWQFGGAALVRATTFGSPSINTWYHIVCWHDATADTINICVNNGTVDSGADAAITVRLTAHLAVGTLGSYVDSSSTWDGLINQAALWKRVLTSGERTTLYNAGNGLISSSW